MQALILAGGEGTRLRPLTSKLPKPVVPLVDQPFIGYMFEWLAGHGVDDVIMSCGFMADGVRDVLGDGSSFGVRLRYVEEPRPLGTGGALKFAEDLLDERFFMLNGDVLTDIDLTAQLEQHERTGARATLALIGVEDPSAYGLVRRRADFSVTEFVEKPGPEQAIDTNLVNAGAYILERELLAEHGAGRHEHLDRARRLPGARGPGPLRIRGQRLLARHRHAEPLPAGHLRHPRGQGDDANRLKASSFAVCGCCPKLASAGGLRRRS